MRVLASVGVGLRPLPVRRANCKPAAFGTPDQIWVDWRAVVAGVSVVAVVRVGVVGVVAVAVVKVAVVAVVRVVAVAVVAGVSVVAVVRVAVVRVVAVTVVRVAVVGVVAVAVAVVRVVAGVGVAVVRFVVAVVDVVAVVGPGGMHCVVTPGVRVLPVLSIRVVGRAFARTTADENSHPAAFRMKHPVASTNAAVFVRPSAALAPAAFNAVPFTLIATPPTSIASTTTATTSPVRRPRYPSATSDVWLHRVTLVGRRHNSGSGRKV